MKIARKVKHNLTRFSGYSAMPRRHPNTSKTLTSREQIRRLGLFSSATIAFGVFPLFLPSAIAAFGGPEGYFNFSLAIIAFGAFQFIVPKYYYRLGKMGFKESSLLI